MGRVIIRLKQSFILVLPSLSGQSLLGERLYKVLVKSAVKVRTPLVDGSGKFCLKYLDRVNFNNQVDSNLMVGTKKSLYYSTKKICK